MHACRSTLEDPTAFGAHLPARKGELDRHLAATAGWSMFRGLAEVARFRTMQPFIDIMGGEKAFLEAVIGRIDLFGPPSN